MNIDILALCDAATDSQGKLNMLGVFDTIFTKSVPTRHPQCAVAIRLRLAQGEQGNHKFSLHIVNKNGGDIVPPVESNFNINFSGSDAMGTVNVILNIQSLKIEDYGEYTINLAIDGKQMASLPFFVKQAS